MFTKISFCIILSLSWHWKSIITAAQECKDGLSYCDQLESFCNNPQYKDYARSNCKKTCKRCPEDLDPNGLCAVNNGNCEQICEVDDEDKNIKLCKCYVGYVLKENKLECADIDECQNEVCPTGEFCTNTRGGFDCDEARCKGANEAAYARRAECCQLEPEDAECGINDAQQRRIVGGNISYAGQWPWQVLILINKATLCGGTLLNSEWVVTAGHCFKGYEEGTTTLELYFGVHNFKKLEQGRVQKRGVKKNITYPAWDEEKFQINDIALIQVDRPVKFNRVVKPVCLPNGEKPKTGTKCFAAGWGLTEEGKTTPSNLLQFVDLPIVDRSKCENNYKDEEIKVNGTFMVCAGYDEGGKDACRGDSGGPLVCQRCDSCGWYLAGVVSFGSGCGRAGLFGVYADVSYYEEWISSQTSISITRGERCTGPSFTPWSNWSECTVSCGEGGKHTRKRECLHKGLQSTGCSGEPQQTVECPLRECARFGAWGDWSKCSKTCGGGGRSQIRKCINGNIGIAACPSDKASKTGVCNTQKCPRWGTWEEWSKCSKTCGDGVATRSRECIDGTASQEGCEGEITETKSCGTQSCPGWSVWGPWKTCSVTCGGGVHVSTRTCNGGKCAGQGTREQACNTQVCPLFGKWGKWDTCDVTCGGGKQYRTRPCENGKLGDVGCEKGKESENQNCNTKKCPKLSEWMDWGKCSVSCGGGTHVSERTCENGEVNQKGCEGPTTRSRDCSTDECIGKLGPWSEWSACSSSCDEGTESKNRLCVGGTKCSGKKEESRSCKVKNCPVFGDWAKWGDCSKSCGGGKHSRTRECLYTDNPGDCSGESEQTETCNDKICPGKWTSWTVWSQCDVSCGEGTSRRTRDCQGGKPGNPGCENGGVEEAKQCIKDPCPSSWGEWGKWSVCSKACDRGLQTRTRPCDGGKLGQGGCVPASDGREEKNCNEFICSACDNWSDNYCDAYFDTPEQCEFPQAEQYCRKKCNLCPGLYENWNQWGPCSSTCGSGEKMRTRDCKNERHGCDGSPSERETCQASCKGFAPWTDWTQCTVSCNGGTHTRSRTCPFDTCEPDETGSSALGEKEPCNEGACPGKWGEWGDWGKCSVTCGNKGEEEIRRKCNGGNPGGPGCPGNDKQTRQCRNIPDCPGKWTEWSDWSDCSVTCGIGERAKTRKCENGIRGQPGCIGEARTTETCDAGKCAAAKWGDWGEWGECDSDCVRSRSRKCTGGRPGVRGCEGNISESEACDPSLCGGQGDSCATSSNTYPRCGELATVQYCAIQSVRDSCEKSCCELENKCEDDPSYKTTTCTYTHLCRDPTYEELFKTYCRKSCGFCTP